MTTRHWLMTMVMVAAPTGGLAKEPNARDGVMWHGGKVRAPVELSSSLRGAVDPGRDLGFTVDARATGDCDPLSLTVQGLGGVEVRGGEARGHGRLDAGQREARTVTVRVPEGRAGHAVVTATCGSGADLRAFVQAFPLHAKGVDPKQSADLAPRREGTPATTGDGRPAQLLDSTN